MDPITASVVGGALVSGVGSYLGSKSAAKAKRDAIRENNRFELQRFARLENILSKVEDPSFDYTKLNPEEFRLIGDYVPDVAGFVAEQDPQFVTGLKTEAARESKGIREQVLRDFLQRASGDDIQADIESQQAVDRTLQTSRGLDDQIIQSLSRRGISGSGLELAARLAGAQRGTEQLAQAQQAAATGAAQRRLAALAQSGQLAGSIRAEEMGMERSNIDILNSFNQRNAARMQQQNRYDADVRNQAALRNLSQRQDLDNRNVSQRNVYQQRERDREDSFKKYQAERDMDRARILGGSQPRVQSSSVADPAAYDALSKLGQAATAYGMSAMVNKNRPSKDYDAKWENYDEEGELKF